MGCSQERSEGFHPLAPAGDLFTSVGDTLSNLGIARTLPTEYVTEISEEQLSDIEAIAVQIPREHIETPNSAFGAGIGHPVYAQQIPLLAEVEFRTNRRFRWYLNPSLPDIAMAMPGGIIVINPAVMGMHSLDTQLFFMFHEAAHHIDGHATAAGRIAVMHQPWLSPTLELRADCYAAKMMMSMGIPNNRIEYAIFAATADKPRTQTHPSGAERLANVRSCLRH